MFRSFTLCFAGNPITKPFKTWQEAAAHALAYGFATRAFNCIFTLVPGATIKKA